MSKPYADNLRTEKVQLWQSNDFTTSVKKNINHWLEKYKKGFDVRFSIALSILKAYQFR